MNVVSSCLFTRVYCSDLALDDRCLLIQGVSYVDGTRTLAMLRIMVSLKKTSDSIDFG